MKVLLGSAGLQLCSLLLALAPAAHSAAAAVAISVVDEQGRPIADVAVYATPASGGSVSVAGGEKAIMDQHDMQFVPHLLVVQAGTEVTFPNADNVSHHVYSFSETKQFELKLYKGDVYPPVTFDRPGVVVLGCNIHDGMLGYVVVVDTAHFAKTDEQGAALIDGVPSGDYVLAAWTPRARPAALPPTQQLTVGEGTVAAEIRINGRLSPAHEHTVSSLTWDRY
ncbi:MAG TPA: methylamine utilization protein [Gammaproteobacteria bacterium]|nr:methylamine utilization protein [Gammaproteobacteria bacterium]